MTKSLRLLRKKESRDNVVSLFQIMTFHPVSQSIIPQAAYENF